MKKPVKNIIVLFVAILTLFVVQAIVKRHAKTKPEPETNMYAQQPVWNLAIEKIVGVRIFSMQREVRFVRQRENWAVVGRAGAFSQTTIKAVIDSLSHVQARLLHDAQANTAVYGLTAPERTVEIQLDDGQKMLLYLGKPTSIGHDYYMQVSGKPDVYLLSGSVAEVFSDDMATYWDTQLPTLDWQNIQSLSITKANGTRIALQYQDKENPQMFSQYCFVSPLSYAGFSVRATAFQDLIKPWVDRVPTKENQIMPVQNWTRYGLHAPSIVLDICDKAGQKLTIHLGRRDANGDYYARLGQENAVFTLAKNYVQPLMQASAFNMLSKFIVLRPKDEITRFVFTGPKGRLVGHISRLKDILQSENAFAWAHALSVWHTMHNEEDALKEQYFLNGEPTTSDQFLTLLEQVVSLKYEAEAQYCPLKPQVVYSLQYVGTGEKNMAQIDFLAYDSEYYLVRLNGKVTSFLVRTYQLNDVCSAVDKLHGFR